LAGISSPFVAFAFSLLPLLIPRAHLDLREERRSLLAADSAYAASASHGLLPAFGDMLDENVIFLEPGETLLFAKAAALERLSADPGSAAATETWRAVRVDVSGDGRAGYTYGFGSVKGPFGSGCVPGPGRVALRDRRRERAARALSLTLAGPRPIIRPWRDTPAFAFTPFASRPATRAVAGDMRATS
jgi:hypothetical protein